MQICIAKPVILRCCGKDMTRGVVQSAREVFFTTEPHRVWFQSRGNGDVSLSSYNFTHPTCIAYICRACQKVVIDYGEMPE